MLSKTTLLAWIARFATIVSLAVMLESTAFADSVVPASAKSLKGIDLDGKLRRLADAPTVRASVVVFLATECPISNGCVPTLNAIHSRYRRRGIEVYGVVSDPSVTRAKAAAHSKEYGIRFPVLFDASYELQRRLQPTHTPHAFVLNRTSDKLYDGLVDDQFVDLGRKKIGAVQPHLDNAIRAVLARTPIELKRTTPVGCLLEPPGDKTKRGEVTYTRDIAPIIQANCTECHRPGQAAPFSLLTYEDVSRRSRQIAVVTRSRLMPPWKPSHGFGTFRDSRRLSAHEIELLDKWSRTGKSRGGAVDLPPKPPATANGWRLGKPDLILSMTEDFHVPASGSDIHQQFVLPTNMREDRLVAAVEFRPGNPRVIHHAAFYLDTTGAARKLDERDPAYGYRGFGGPSFRIAGSLRSWLPGMTPRRLPAGTGRPMLRTADFVMEVHYRCTGKPERDRSKIGIYFAPRKSRQLVIELQVFNKLLTIPAGARRHHHRSSYTLPVETILLDVVPHMHVLGREMKAMATLPDGKVRPLVWIEDWDFNWQGQYTYARPMILPAGTRIDVESWYDNSAKNRLNPNSPPQTVYWGQQTSDEMDICHFHVTCRSLAGLNALTRHFDSERARNELQYRQSIRNRTGR